jgi:tetratricopeptide (TPR) repeat protein
MQKIRELLDLTEENVEDLRFLGYSYIRQGHYDIGLTFFEGLSLLSDEHPYDFQTLGALYLQTDQYEKAKVTLEKALLLNPEHSNTLLNHAKTLLLLGKRDAGLLRAHELSKDTNTQIANDAQALILAYS